MRIRMVSVVGSGSPLAPADAALARKIGRPVLVSPATRGTAAVAARTLEKVATVATPEEAVRRLRELL